MGCPKFGLNRLSVARPSSAVSLSSVEHVEQQLDASDAAECEVVLDTRRSSSDCDDSRREPRGSSRMRWLPCGSDTCVVAAHGLPLKYCRFAGDHEAGPRHVDAAHDAEHVRPIVRQPAARVGEIVRIAPERQVGPGGRDGADLRAAQRSPRWRPAARRPSTTYTSQTPATRRAAFFDDHHEAVVGQRVAVGIRQQEAASGRSDCVSSTNTGTLRPSGSVRVSSRY